MKPSSVVNPCTKSFDRTASNSAGIGGVIQVTIFAASTMVPEPANGDSQASKWLRVSLAEAVIKANGLLRYLLTFRLSHEVLDAMTWHIGQQKR